MTETIIHHVRVTYDETDERVRDFVVYLKHQGRKDEMAGYYGSAAAAYPKAKYILLGKNEFSFSCDADHRCILKSRGVGV